VQKRSWPTGLVVKTFACATAYPSSNGALIRFYIRRDFMVRYNGMLGIRRAELLATMELKGEHPRPSRPRRLYSFMAEGLGFGGE
jgi:hypothetical protein